MYILKIDPFRVLPSEEPLRVIYPTHPEEVDHLDPVLVYEMPPEHRSIADFVVHDGNKRRAGAEKARVQLRVLVLETPLDFKETPDYNLPRFYEMTPERFEEFRQGTISDALKLYN